jgi:hypothetical protein
MTLTLEPGDLLLQYTDGINVAADLYQEPFGFERLEKAVLDTAHGGCHAAILGIEGAIESWTSFQAPLDDQTLLVVSREGNRVGNGGSPPDPAHRPALAALAEARRAGTHLVLGADKDSLIRIPAWLAQCPGLGTLAAEESAELEYGLHEVCSNIVEHGYDGDPSKSFHLWWLSADDGAAGTPATADNGGMTAPAQKGRFVILDHGTPFPIKDGKDGKRLHLADLAVRRRRRGPDLERIEAALHRVSYHPGTVRGNITLLDFDSQKIRDHHAKRRELSRSRGAGPER